MRLSFLPCVLALLLVPAAPASAQVETIPPVALIVAAPPASGAETPVPKLVRTADSGSDAERPPALLPLYASLSALNALDVHSTLSGIASGSLREANPVVQPFVSNRGVFIAFKAGTTATAILLTERMRKKHPKRAVVVMVAVNAAMAAIVANNYRALRR